MDSKSQGQIVHADCVEAMAAMEEGSIHAIATDPPYGYHFMGKAWDYLNRGEPDNGDGAAGRMRGRAPRMNTGHPAQEWHHRWALEALRVLKPGAHLAAMGGTRTVHRLACALEDAGFEVRDTLCWQYLSGFPKNARTTLKPSWEPIVVARKPLSESSVARNVLEHGCGDLDIDACRPGWDGKVGVSVGGGWGGKQATQPGSGGETMGEGWRGCYGTEPHAGGLWPANTIRTEPFRDERDRWFLTPCFDPEVAKVDDALLEANGFFFVPKASRSEREFGCEGLEEGRPLHGPDCKRGKEKGLTTSQAKTRRRNTHPTCKPIALFRHLVRLLTPPGGTVLDPFFGSGTTGIAAHLEGFAWIGVEQDEHYCEIAEARTKAWSQQLCLEV